jgi:hypothetical protein
MAAAVGCCAWAGCSDTVPVRGTVMREDSKVSGGTVMFRPVGPGKPAYGVIQSDGTFELATNRDGDGAMAGEYRVTVTGENDPETGSAGTTYVGPRKTTYKVVAGEINDFDIEISVDDGWRAVVDD